MAHVVGVPRRDPCLKCQLPVFLAERLAVGKKIYHRTCLKCARCGSQLTPGSFYETETDNEYCCETCPDEEDVGAEATTSNVLLRNTASDEDAITSSPPPSDGVKPKTMRSSIADRLAFFEQNKSTETPNAAGNKLLQKSVSDEEKTKSLQRMEAETTAYKKNTALSNFLYDTTDGQNDVEGESETTSTADDKTETQMETSDTEETEDDLSNTNLPPELPQTLPPEVEIRDSNEKSPSKRFTSTAQLQLISTHNEESEVTTNQQEESIIEDVLTKPEQEEKKTEDQFNLPTTEPELTAAINNNANNNDDYVPNTVTDDSHKPTQKSLEITLDISQTNDNDCVTKDKTADLETAAAPATNKQQTENIVQMKAATEELESESSTDAETNDPQPVVLRQKSLEQVDHGSDVATTERLSVVRARLQQFEVIANNKNNNTSTNINNNNNASVKNDHENQNDSKLSVSPTTNTLPPSINADISQNSNLTESDEPKSMLLERLNEEKEEDKEEEEEEELKPMEVEIEMESPKKVPLNTEIEDSENVENEPNTDVAMNVEKRESIKDSEPEETSDLSTSNSKKFVETYPEDLNPFQSDDEEQKEENNKENLKHSVPQPSPRTTKKPAKVNDSSNPFDSSDDEIELNKSQTSTTASTPTTKVPPPRPPPPRISRNPFGDDTDEESSFSRHSSLSSSLTKKTPVPTPRTNLSQSQNPTPEPTPRLSNKTPQSHSSNVLQNSSEYYGSANSLSTTPHSLLRNSDIRGSNNSITSSSGGTARSRKSRKAPAPPLPPQSVKELFPSTETINSSKTSTPSSSTRGSPRSSRKKRIAPAPPKPARLDPSLNSENNVSVTPPKNLLNYPLQSELDSKLSDEEKALLEGKSSTTGTSQRSGRRLIPLDASLLEDFGDVGKSDDLKSREHYNQSIEANEVNVVYRRVIIPPNIDSPTHERSPMFGDLNAVSHDRQLEKLKDNKEAKNRNRQSQVSASSGAEDADPLYNKSSHGKWKRRKGPAPALPVPPRRVLQMLPLQEIRHELEIIEVQQQGLEKQGVILEKMIRDRCEGQNGEMLCGAGGDGVDGSRTSSAMTNVQNSKEVEDLILQLFELVNEKNDLFRRQAELMYLRRQHRLEQEQADLEYEIRVLMAQPERNKTDSDKAREESLIARLVEVVQLRNEVVECLEMDRLREAEEDLSIKQRLEMHTSRRDDTDDDKKSSAKLSKKEKKKQKEGKKLSKNKKIDADKDADETELSAEKQKIKKKKKKFLF